MKKIAFHSEKICLRGSCVSLYDYAYYNENILNGKSIIITHKTGHDEVALHKFIKKFEIRYYDNEEDLEDLSKDCDIFYTIKYGKNGYLPTNIKTCVHCVFDLSEPHGDIYAAVSETLAKKYNKTVFVPHMIGLQPSKTNTNLRKTLGIPTNAIVFGRHGGPDTFDLNFVKKAIINVVNFKEDIHFIFVNTPQFYNHPRIHHIDKIVDLDEKNRFICSCDAMIHAQSLGETFGIAIGEFSVNNKPIITYNGKVWNDNYKYILKDKAIWYENEHDCYSIMLEFNPEKYKNKDLNCYRDYTPEKVMSKFKEVFIDMV
jgi:hypothetical protein|tara:strand:+ start:9446 stop:10390 length:945 start_codon:yes stop_codon:yes gene_type:complete